MIKISQVLIDHWLILVLDTLMFFILLFLHFIITEDTWRLCYIIKDTRSVSPYVSEDWLLQNKQTRQTSMRSTLFMDLLFLLGCGSPLPEQCLFRFAMNTILCVNTRKYFIGLGVTKGNNKEDPALLRWKRYPGSGRIELELPRCTGEPLSNGETINRHMGKGTRWWAREEFILLPCRTTLSICGWGDCLHKIYRVLSMSLLFV